MLIDRRQALVTLGLATLSGAAWSLPASLLPPRWEGGQAVLDKPDTALDDRLRADLERMTTRIHSEEGIPMFLACVNLVPTQAGQAPPRAALTPLNTALSAVFWRNVEAFQRIDANPQSKDVAPLIELLATRDFARGGTTEEA